MAGYLLYNTDFKKHQRYILYACGVGGWLLRFLYDGINTFKTSSMSSIYGGYMNFNNILTAAAIFMLFKSIDFTNIENKWIGKMINILSSASFGVYLIHWYVMFWITKEYSIDTRSVKWIVFGTFLVYTSSVLIVLIIKKIPILKKLIP